MLSEIMGRFGILPKRLDDLEVLAKFLDDNASYISQSAAYSYCRARTGFMAPKLFDETTFLGALEETKWDTYLAVLSDLFLIVEGALRPPDLAGQEKILEVFCHLFGKILERHPPPVHRSGGWDGAVEEFRTRLAQSQMVAVKELGVVSNHSGKILFDSVPIYPEMKKLDEEMVINSVRSRVLRFGENLSRRLRPEPIMAEVLAGKV